MSFDECHATIYRNGIFEKVSVGEDTWYNFDTQSFINQTSIEIRALYVAKLNKAHRLSLATDIRRKLEEESLVAERVNVARVYVRKLRKVYSGETLQAIFTLLKTKTFRSPFRQSLRNQIVHWLTDKNPRFTAPLSPKQLSYLN